MKTYIIIGCSALLLLGCGTTPNNVQLSPNQGICAQLNQYSPTAQQQLQSINPVYYTLLQNNPPATTITPYCMAITVQNNNSGVNANNIQIVNSGLLLTTTPSGGTPTSVRLYDPNAALVTITNAQQQVNNLILFDPTNCATTNGLNVKTLNSSGGNCTFYLELQNESSFVVGNYPLNIAYNYTNGNANYTANININQRVNLFGGSSTGLVYLNSNVSNAGITPTTAPTWQIGVPGSPTANIQFLLRQNLGFMYFISLNQVYMYNGLTTTTIGKPLPSVATSLALDAQNNLYVSTTTNGLWVYASTTSQWIPVTDTNNLLTSTASIIGLKGPRNISPRNILYVTTESAAFGCSNLNIESTMATESCITAITGSGSITPTKFFLNALDVDSANNLVAGGRVNGLLGISPWNGLFNWGPQLPLPIVTDTPNTGIGGVTLTNPNPSLNSVYVGLINESATESSAVYNCSIASCQSVVSTESNPLTGNINTTITDGLGNLYVAGTNLISNDWESSGIQPPVTGAILLFNQSATLPNQVYLWLPVIGAPTTLNSLIISSSLTSN